MRTSTEPGDTVVPHDAMACPLCHQPGETLAGTEFLRCVECQGVYRHWRHHLAPVDEKARYDTHNNDVNDPGYQQFVSPIVSAVLRDFRPGHSGLDFGAGPGPVISKLLLDRGYHIVQYDPFFHPHPTLLEGTYDFIVCCEVMEHFRHPDVEFARLRRLLRPGGRLYCMTSLYRADADFRNWSYIRDRTHVFIYHPATLAWVRQHFGFTSCAIEGRLITLS
ncbi:MAG: class I SAM-dependent methyltransferase [Lentisphaeria bacterium]|nr:class I SAM-dependent methyltransferase [Lentisphaeria bacterium]